MLLFEAIGKKCIYIIMAAIATCLSFVSQGQGANLLWENKWDVNFFTTRETGFSTDSKYYAIGGDNGMVTIYEAATGNVYDRCQLHDKQVFCTLFQPGGNLMASGDKKGTLVIYDYVSKTKKFTIQAHEGALTAMSFSNDGSLLITGGRDNAVKIWDPLTGNLVSAIYHIKGNIHSVKITPQKKTLIIGTAAMSRGIRIYDVASGAEIMTLGTSNLQKLDLSPDGNFIAVANLEKTLDIWNLQQYRFACVLMGHRKTLTDVSYDRIGRFLASSSEDRTVIVWDAQTKRQAAIINGKQKMSGVSFSPNGKYLAVMNEDHSLSMWEMK